MTTPDPGQLAEDICTALVADLRAAVLEPKAQVTERHLAAWSSVLAAVDALVMAASGGSAISKEYAMSQQASRLRSTYPQCVHLFRTLQALHGPQPEASRG